MPEYLITGAGGMLGQDLRSALEGREVRAATRADLDITDLDAVRDAADGVDAIINAAAFTKVDAAEEQEQEAYRINATGAQILALAARENNAKLVQLSTDYVFDGTAAQPYPEEMPLSPVSAYGRTKAAGERLAAAAHPAGTVIVRTAWLYGAHGPNFAATMLRLAETHPTVTVVHDQVGQPTWTMDVARQIVSLLDSGAPAGVYHATNSGRATWFEFAREVFRLAGLDPERVLPTTSAEFVRPAPRPAFSVLGHRRWQEVGLTPMRPWKQALAEAAAQGVFGS